MFFRYKRSSNYLKQNLFHSRMIRPVVGGGGPTYLKQPPAPGGWKPVHSQARVDFLFTSMHRMHRIFSGDGWLVFPDILKSAHDHRPSQRAAASRPDYPVHPVHRCSIYSPSRWICPVAGGGAPGSQANGSFPKGTGRLSEKSPAGYPPPHHRDDTPRERGRPARMLSLRLPLSFPAMLQPTALPAGTAWARPKQRQGAAAG